MSQSRMIIPQKGAVGALRDTATSHIGLRVPDVSSAADFYGRVLGLVVQERAGDGSVQLGWGVGHHVIDLAPGPRGLVHYGFEVRGAGELERVRERVLAAGHPVVDLDPRYKDNSTDETAGFASSDSDGTAVHFHGPVWRQGESSADTGRRPVRYQHITLGTSDVRRLVDFYVSVVGFRISDQLQDGRFAWLRSNNDHHTLAVVDVGRGGDIDHYSYDLAEWEDFKTWCDRLTDQGVRVTWGPGRHGPGNNLFVFFDDPAGNHVELSAEMEKFYDDRVEYVPRRWAPTPTSVNLWGGQLASWRHTSEHGE